MGYKLCIAEKPSAAKDIAAAIGAYNKKGYYYEGNDYLVTWAIGHLVGLAEPEAYGYESQKEMWSDGRDKAYGELPILPREYKLIVLENTKSQFNAIKKLMERPDVDMIIDCGDMGPEGHLLQWMIREKAGCSKPVMRFCATSLTDEAIRKAMANLRPITDFTDIITGQFCKKKADWSLGMSVSRAMSLNYNANISVGRVQTPTLYFVVKRHLEAENFKIADYYTMSADMDGGYTVTWEKDTENIFDASIKDPEGRVLQKWAVQATADQIIHTGGTGTVKKADTVKAKTERPQLFDITELQRDANKKFGYSAALTLAAAQSLYETHKIISYPRTDSRYITTDIAPLLEDYIKSIAGIDIFKQAAETVLSTGLNLDKRIVDDTKVTDHHALICTEKIKGFDISNLTATANDKKSRLTDTILKNVLTLILGRMLTALSEPYIYWKTNIEIGFPVGLTFKASGTTPIAKGWKAVQELLPNGKADDTEKDKDNQQKFPSLTIGQTVKANAIRVLDKKTTPPKLHTEATLLTAMENAGAMLGEDGAILKGKGIGTPATRAEIIKKLFDMGYVMPEKSGKTTYIKPVKKGISLIREIPNELRSPKITAQWEDSINNICDGKQTDTEFMTRFAAFIREMITGIKSSEGYADAFKREPETVGVCPWCKGAVHKFTDYKTKETCYYCGKKCGWRLDANSKYFTEVFLSRPLNEKEAIKFISQSYLDLEVLNKNGSPYKRRFAFEAVKSDDGTRTFCNIKSDFAPR